MVKPIYPPINIELAKTESDINKLRKYVYCELGGVQRSLLLNPHVTPELIDIISKRANCRLKMIIAKREDILLETYKRLSEDVNYHIRLACTLNKAHCQQQ